jgi:hypothetical protein
LGGFGKTAIFFLPPSIRNRGGAPAVPCMAAAGEWSKMERRLRGIDPRAHLVLGLLAEAASRVGMAVLGGGDASVFKREGSSVVVVRGEPGSCRPLFIGGIRWFGRPIFRARGAPAAGNGVDSAGGIRGQSGVVGRDPSCRGRAGRGSGDAERTTVVVVLEGTARVGAFKAAAAVGRQGEVASRR